MYDEKNTECLLYGTDECEMLNQKACLSCAVAKLKPDQQQDMKDALSRLAAAAPKEKVETLYTSGECRFCKGEDKHKADCFALFDMSKPDEKGDWSFTISKTKLAAKTGFMLLPLQAACCRDCKKRFRLKEFLPGVVSILIALAGLLVSTAKPVYDSLYASAPWLPAAVFLGSAAVALAVGNIVRRALIASAAKKTELDLEALPEVRELEQTGWKLTNKKRCGAHTPVFAKKLRGSGVYTIPEPEKTKDEGGNAQENAE